MSKKVLLVNTNTVLVYHVAKAKCLPQMLFLVHSETGCIAEELEFYTNIPLVSATGSVSLQSTVCQLKSTVSQCLLPFPIATDARLFLCVI